jgi:hypothetical protein
MRGIDSVSAGWVQSAWHFRNLRFERLGCRLHQWMVSGLTSPTGIPAVSGLRRKCRRKKNALAAMV